MSQMKRKLKTPSIREKFVTLLLNKDFRLCARMIQEHPENTAWYFDLVRETYTLSPFWEVSLSAMIASSNPNIKDIFISSFLIKREYHSDIGGEVIGALVSNEASRENMERFYSKVHNLYKEAGLKNTSNNPDIKIEPLYDRVTGQTYYVLMIYPGAGKRLVLEQYDWIMNKYKEAGIYQKWQEKKDTVKQLQAVLLSEIGESYKATASAVGEADAYNVNTLIKRGKKKLEKLKA